MDESSVPRRWEKRAAQTGEVLVSCLEQFQDYLEPESSRPTFSILTSWVGKCFW